MLYKSDKSISLCAEEIMSMFPSNTWLRRAKEGFMQAIGSHTATEDAEFDSKLRSFQMHTAELQRMRQLMELWMESFDTFCASSQLLSDGWKSYYSHSPYVMTANSESPFVDVASELDRVLGTIHNVVQPAVKETFSERCLQPLVSILAIVPTINDKVQQRKTLLLDYDAYKAKMQKKVGTGKESVVLDMTRRTEKFDESTLKLRAVQEEICNNFAEFEAARPVTLGPELAAYLGCLHSFSATLSASTATILPAMPQAASSIHRISAASVQYSAAYMKRMPANALQRGLKISEGFHTPRSSIRKADPVLSRSEYSGGAYGGYVQTPSSFTTSSSRFSAPYTSDVSTSGSVPSNSIRLVEAENAPTLSVDSSVGISKATLIPNNSITTGKTTTSSEDARSTASISSILRPASEPVKPSTSVLDASNLPGRSSTPPPKPPRNKRSSTTYPSAASFLDEPQPGHDRNNGPESNIPNTQR